MVREGVRKLPHSFRWGKPINVCTQLLVFGMLCFGSIEGSSQTTIWSVDFETGYSDNDASAQDNNSPSGADWTKSGSPSNWWRVESDNVLAGSLSMSGRNTDATMTWTSESIDISGFSNVSISIDIKEINCDDGSSDQIETFYNVGSGNVEFGDGNGDGNFNNATNTIAGLSGSSLTITVTLFNNGGGERCIFDNIVVTGVSELGGDGPGGVGDTDGSGSLSLWLDANQGVSLSGSAVTQWSDQSGYGNNATPPASANRPSYSSSAVNSHPSITFDGSNDYLTASDATSLDLTTWTIIVVGIVNTHKNYNAFVVKGDDADENYEFLTNFPSTGNFHYPVKYTTSARSTDSESGETMSTSSYGVYQLDYDQSNFQFYINGDLTETDSETRTPQTNSNSLYICNEESTTGRNANASVAEIIIFSTPINQIQRLLIHNAMAAKYGFSMDANDLYDEDNSGYDFDVAGIGQASDGTSHQDGQGTGIVRVRNPSGLANGEYFIWGHDNGELDSDAETDLPTGIEARIVRTWRASETGEVGTLTISFDLSSVPGTKTTSDLRLLIDRDNDGVFSDETEGGGGVVSGASNTSGSIYEWTGIDIDNNERFTIGTINYSQTPLPIELTHFQAQAIPEEEVIRLNWVTQSEINNSHFILEKTEGDGEFARVGEITGQGTTSESHTYEFYDYEPWTGTTYYRLTQVDEDGKQAHYPLEAVDYELPTPEVLTAFPNPLSAGERLHIQFSTLDHPDLLEIKIHDQAGKVVDLSQDPSLQLNPGELSINLPSNLPSGVYVTTLITAQQYVHYIPLVVR
ncbi:hypothetical protein KFE98_03160 [bacterium SCSIO 12741]|nr:hypothetical protein KFE98_03160 [bacterium SCSIO 12741]